MYPPTATLTLFAILFLNLSSACQTPQTDEETSPTVPEATIERPAHVQYAWHTNPTQENLLVNAITPPAGFRHAPVTAGSFEEWLRFLPLKPGRPQVKLYNGAPKGNQRAHFKVIDMDVGKRDLQQCADAVMRLRAEFQYSSKAFEAINFNFTSGDPHPYSKWLAKQRPVINGNAVSWRATTDTTGGYPLFRAYLTSVFNWSGTYSISRQMRSVPIEELQAGDVFVQGGFPGHAVIVVEVVENEAGEKRFLLAQSYMPAQEMHILRNPANPDSDPWYRLPTDLLQTPEWTFSKADLHRF